MRRRSLLLLLLSALLTSSLWSRSSPPQALRKDVIVPNTKGRESWDWISPREVVFLESAPDEQARLFQPVALNVLSGRRQPLHPFPDTTLFPHISPNGRWCLYPDEPVNATRWQVMGMTSGRTIDWPLPPQDVTYNTTDTCWMPDSRRWIRWEDKKEGLCLSMYSLDRPQEVKRLSYPGYRLRGNIITITPEDELLIWHEPNWYTHQKQFQFTHISLKKPPAEPPAPTVIPLPDPLDADCVIRAALSSDGKRMAWEADLPITEQDLKDPRLQSYSDAKLRNFKVWWRSLWISSIHGEQMREIWREPYETPSGSCTETHRSFSWSPDGRRLSFYFQGQMRLITVDR